MSKRKVMSVAFTGVAATGLAGFAAAPALAIASTWNVTGGGHVTGKNAGANTFSDTTTHQKITCAVSDVKASGSVPNGTSKPGTSIGFISHFSPGYGGTAHGCTGPLGTVFNGNLTGANYHVNAVSQAAGTSVTHGTITGIHVKAHTVAGPACSFSASGTATGTYTNATGILNTTGATLHIKVITGCAPLLATGNTATYTGPLTVVNGTGGHPQLHHNTT